MLPARNTSVVGKGSPDSLEQEVEEDEGDDKSPGAVLGGCGYYQYFAEKEIYKHEKSAFPAFSVNSIGHAEDKDNVDKSKNVKKRKQFASLILDECDNTG